MRLIMMLMLTVSLAACQGEDSGDSGGDTDSDVAWTGFRDRTFHQAQWLTLHLQVNQLFQPPGSHHFTHEGSSLSLEFRGGTGT